MFIDGPEFFTGKACTHKTCFTFQKIKKARELNRKETTTVISHNYKNSMR